MHLLVVLACHHIMVVLPVKRLIQMLLYLHHSFNRLAHLFNDLDLADDLGILWLGHERNLLRLLPNALVEELLVEGVVLVVVLAVGH